MWVPASGGAARTRFRGLAVGSCAVGLGICGGVASNGLGFRASLGWHRVIWFVFVCSLGVKWRCICDQGTSFAVRAAFLAGVIRGMQIGMLIFPIISS
jgi:hypothetical protein